MAVVKIDPDSAGMDPGRLAQIDRHLTERYLTPGKLAGCQVLVARHGHVAYLGSFGHRDRERQLPADESTIWRLYSMTKPVTGVALLTLYEQAHFHLDDPVHRFIPAWRDLKVREVGQYGQVRLVEPDRPMTVRHLMMHMAGLGYSLSNRDLEVDRLRQAPGTRMGEGMNLAAMTDRLAEAPLRYHPGQRWLYSLATDVCGRLVEVISGQRFDDYLRDTVFGPLGMTDTAFWVPPEQAHRLAASYERDGSKQLVVLDDPAHSPFLEPPTFLSGGAGLVGTIGDYGRFCQMLLNGGELDGTRVLSRKTVELMRSNHLPGGREMADFANPGGYGEVGFEGMGFGLTVAVASEPARTGVVGSAGEFMWGGAASTLFWVDPAEDLLAVFMTQLVPSGTFNFRAQLKSLVYAALAD